jgi:hypothetical protein
MSISLASRLSCALHANTQVSMPVACSLQLPYTRSFAC